MINIERDGSRQMYHPGKNPPVAINLYVIFYTYFAPNNYLEGLKFISGVISFFQSRSSFESHDTPYLPPEADKILTFSHLHPYLSMETSFRLIRKCLCTRQSATKNFAWKCWTKAKASIRTIQWRPQRQSPGGGGNVVGLVGLDGGNLGRLFNGRAGLQLHKDRGLVLDPGEVVGHPAKRVGPG